MRRRWNSNRRGKAGTKDPGRCSEQRGALPIVESPRRHLTVRAGNAAQWESQCDRACDKIAMLCSILQISQDNRAVVLDDRDEAVKRTFCDDGVRVRVPDGSPAFRFAPPQASFTAPSASLSKFRFAVCRKGPCVLHIRHANMVPIGSMILRLRINLGRSICVHECRNAAVPRATQTLFSRKHFYKLSDEKTSNAMRCRMNSPRPPIRNWNARSPNANRSSRMGPNHTSHKLISVKLDDDSTCPFASTSTLSSRSRCSNLRLSAIGRCNGLRNSTREGSSKPVRALKCGSRCRGHGTRWKSCGAEYTKLKACGRRSNISVLLKWPRMATTAKTMPAK